MRRDATRLLVLVGIGWLCVTGTVFADDRNQEHQTKHENQGYHGHHGHRHHARLGSRVRSGRGAGGSQGTKEFRHLTALVSHHAVADAQM